ncbi:DUF3137 domain-containing protein [Pyruvatibacter sp.]|uniref:DUF3137 domain-containing protein n=1 Tax=Pyruvatibacter sp. TaxID=1981328 RepID=UPI0032EE7AD1
MPLSETEAMHPRLDGFAAFYRRDLEPFLLQQEILRAAAYARLKSGAFIAIPLMIVGVAVVGLMGGFSAGWLGYVPAGIVLLAGIGFLGYRTAAVYEVTSHVKQELMTRICDFLGFVYTAEPSTAGLQQFRATGILPDYDRANAEDEIAGTHESVAFTLYEAHLEDRRTRRSNGRTETYYVTVFRGVLARFTFPKRFAGRTVLLRDGGVIGNFFAGIGKGATRVKLEDPKFEKQFQVFSDDQVEARYLLTPTFMERTLALAEALEGTLQLSFDDNRLLISVNGGDDRFEGGGLFARVDDPQQVAKMVEEIGIVFQIIDDLKLTLSTRS